MGGDILARIVETRRQALAVTRRRVPAGALEERRARRRDFRDFGAALAPPGIRIVAEIKRASPSRGEIAPGLDAPRQARRYQQGGAVAISVLTEPEWFRGSLEDLEAVRAAVRVPVLRKDFLFDRYQVLESAAHGADAVLLIARILEDALLEDLLAYTDSLKMTALVEIHDAEDARRVSAMNAPIIGINNRDLRTFGVDPGVAEALLRELPPDRRIVAASGIRGPEDVRRAHAAGMECFLVGESLVRAADPVAQLRALRDVSGAAS